MPPFGFSHVAVVGGVMINRYVGGDCFQPLTFESRKQGEKPLDLFSEAFGPRPDLGPVLGSGAAVDRLYTRGSTDIEAPKKAPARKPGA